MSPQAALLLEQDLRIPAEVYDLARFRRWTASAEFPDHGRIDYLDGEVYVEGSPENPYFHGTVKTAISAALQAVVSDTDRGAVFVDRTRVVSLPAGLSVEPDVVVLLWPTVESGRVREVESVRAGESFIELEGSPDLVVEIASDSSARKDRDLLPPLYARAGVPEIWRIDARGGEVAFEAFQLAAGGYSVLQAESDGCVHSPVLKTFFRLVRRASGPLARPAYTLERR